VGGIGVGIVLGAFNGMLVNFTGLHPFIITLGTNAIFRGRNHARFASGKQDLPLLSMISTGPRLPFFEIVGHAMIAIVLHLSCTLKRMPIYSVEIMFSSPVALPSDGTKTQFDYPCASAT